MKHARDIQPEAATVIVVPAARLRLSTGRVPYVKVTDKAREAEQNRKRARRHRARGDEAPVSVNTTGQHLTLFLRHGKLTQAEAAKAEAHLLDGAEYDRAMSRAIRGLLDDLCEGRATVKY